MFAGDVSGDRRIRAREGSEVAVRLRWSAAAPSVLRALVRCLRHAESVQVISDPSQVSSATAPVFFSVAPANSSIAKVLSRRSYRSAIFYNLLISRWLRLVSSLQPQRRSRVRS